MNILHEKSPCCRGVVRRFGGRRRQCKVCGKTWSMWQRTRGRTRLRVSPDLAHRFIDIRLLPVRVSRSGASQSRNERQYRLAASRRQCAMRCPWPTQPPAESLIAVADALVKQVERQWYTWYFVLVRGLSDTKAVILPPYYERGTETVQGWDHAFSAVPQDIQSRIRALVADGHRGLVFRAKRQNWHLQRCHFHLIARLQGRRSRWRTGRHTAEGKRIFYLVHQLLTVPNEALLLPLMNELEEIGWTSGSPEIRRVLIGFINHLHDYRTYLRYPELLLPVTNNTAETLIGLVERVSRHARGFRTVSVLHEWITVVIKTRRTIRCAPKNQQN